MWEALAGLAAIAVVLLRHWLQPRAGEERQSYEEDKQRLDRALAARDADGLSAMFDELRQAGGQGSRDPGGPDDPAAR